MVADNIILKIKENSDKIIKMTMTEAEVSNNLLKQAIKEKAEYAPLSVLADPR